jgi:hypothetical protein
MHLGDPVKRAVTDERAALTILRGINAGIRTGVIPDTSPLCRIDISSARQLAKLAMHGGLEVLGREVEGLNDIAGAMVPRRVVLSDSARGDRAVLGRQ